MLIAKKTTLNLSVVFLLSKYYKPVIFCVLQHCRICAKLLRSDNFYKGKKL